MLKVKNLFVKNAVFADMGSLALSISDSSLFSWVKMAVRFYKQLSSLEVSRSVTAITTCAGIHSVLLCCTLGF